MPCSTLQVDVYKRQQLFHRMISAALGISEKQIGHTLDLLEDGATIHFISRYRKEATGGLDEVKSDPKAEI